MTRKNKIITSVALLSLAIFGMVMGVYSLVQRQVTINGTVSFSASTVRATYTISRTDAYTGETVAGMTQIASGTFNESNQNNATETLGNIMLSDNAERFAYEVVINSTEAVRDLHVSFTVPAPVQTWLSVLVNGEAAPETTTVIPAGQSFTATFVIIADALNAPESVEDIDIGTSFNIGLSEEDVMADFQQRMIRQQQKLQNQNNQNPVIQNNQTQTNQNENISNNTNNNAGTYNNQENISRNNHNTNNVSENINHHIN